MILTLSSSFLLLVAILLGAGCWGLFRLEAINRALQSNVTKHWSDVTMSLEALQLSYTNNRLVTEMVLEDQEQDIEPRLALRKENSEKITRLMNQLEASGLSIGQENRLFEDVRKTRARYIESYKGALTLLEEHRMASAKMRLLKETVPLLIEYHRAWGAFLDLQGQQMKDAIKESDIQLARARRLIIFFLCLVALICFLLGVVVVRNLATQIASRERAQQELSILNAALEQKVALRTAELVSSNRDLEGEIIVRKRTEEELRRARDEAEQLLSSIASILIGVDERGVVTRWNAAATVTFLISPEQALGHKFRDLAISWQQPDIWERLCSIALSGEAQRMEDVTTLDNDGKVKILGLAIHPLRGVRGQFSGFVLLGVDVSERRILQEQLRQAQKLESMGQLAAGIAHEINTPTQFIGDNIRFLRNNWDKLKTALMGHLADSTADNGAALEQWQLAANDEMAYLVEEVPKALDQSLDGVARVSRIVAAMREFSHPGSEKQSADINRALDVAVTVSRNEWKYVAELRTDFEPALPFVECMVHEFQQAILNILINAAQAIAEKIGKDASPKGTILVSTRRKDGCVEIRIQDDGGGIPAAIRNRVFEPFFTTKPVGKGTGQGLALVHNVIVKKHSGRVWIESEPGQGTTVVMQLPIGDDANGEVPVTQPLASSVPQ